MGSLRFSRSLVGGGLFVVMVLLANEVWHLDRWDSKGERRFIPAAHPAGCTPSTSIPNYMWCDVPGFGKTLFRCTRKLCAYQDPSAPLLSLQDMEREEADMNRMFAPDEVSTPDETRK